MTELCGRSPSAFDFIFFLSPRLCPPKYLAVQGERGGRRSREAGKPAGPLSGAGMQKMWKQLGSESRGFQSPEVTKGFSPGEGGSGPLIVMGEERKQPLNWVSISGQTGWLHNADTQEKGMQTDVEGGASGRLNGVLIKASDVVFNVKTIRMFH